MPLVSLKVKRACALCWGLKAAQSDMRSWSIACSLGLSLSKFFDMVSHLFFCAALICDQWGAKGARAFCCWASNFCQLLSGATVCARACPALALNAMQKTRQKSLKAFNLLLSLEVDWTSGKPRSLGRCRRQAANHPSVTLRRGMQFHWRGIHFGKHECQQVRPSKQ